MINNLKVTPQFGDLANLASGAPKRNGIYNMG